MILRTSEERNSHYSNRIIDSYLIRRCLVWPFGRSSRVIDSCSETADSRISSDCLFSSSVCEYLTDAVQESLEDTQMNTMIVFHRYTCLMHYRQDIVTHLYFKYVFFNHICSISTHCSVKMKMIKGFPKCKCEALCLSVFIFLLNGI